VQPRFLTPQEYLEIESKSEIKSEYWNGRIYPMIEGWPRPGDSEDILGEPHFAIITQLVAAVALRLKGEPWCVSIGVSADEPDCSIVSHEDGSRVVVEVLSPSTEAADRGVKLHRYLRTESIKEYVLVSHESPCVETFERLEMGSARFQAFEGLQSSVTIRTAGIDVPLAEIYDGITFRHGWVNAPARCE
jgi:Uma2 family endonuclease